MSYNQHAFFKNSLWEAHAHDFLRRLTLAFSQLLLKSMSSFETTLGLGDDAATTAVDAMVREAVASCEVIDGRNFRFWLNLCDCMDLMTCIET